MARIAANEQNSTELRGRMYADLAQYVYVSRVGFNVPSDSLSSAGFQGDYVWPVLGDCRGSSAVEDDSGVEEIQSRLLQEAIREGDAGDGPLNPSGIDR
jgi:hypothetical protein